DTPEEGVLHAEIAILHAKALCQAGAYARAQGLCEHALLHLPEEERELRAAAEMRLGICANLQGQFAAGITHLQQALHILANQPPPNQASAIHSSLANTYYLIENGALAEHHLSHALHFCEQAHDHEGQVNNLILQGILAQDQGAYPEAEEAFLHALALARASSHSRRGEAYALVNLGSLALEQGSYRQALRFSEDGLALARQWGNRSLASVVLSNLALIHLFLGDPTSALHYVEKIEVQASNEKTIGYEWAWRELTYGMILLVQGRYQQARACLAEIEAQLRTTDLKRGIFQAKLRLAASHLALDQPEESVHLLEEAALLLASSGRGTHLVRLELQWLPMLLPLVERHPHLASLRKLLGLEEPLQSQAKNAHPSSNLALAETGSVHLTILAFGEPAVFFDEQPITRWRMARAMELFFFLLERDQPISKESILTALWPECDGQTNQTFHSTLHHLRKLLGEGCLVFGAGGYRLDLSVCYGDQVSYDVSAFQRSRLEAEQALARQDERNARDALLTMVALYRGDYGRPFYNDWCTLRRDELRAAYLEARRQLAKLAWQAEAWSESAEHWRHLLLLDNCLEEAHSGLIRCYLRQGKRGAALRQYQSCQKILREELGIQPSPALQQLYERLTAK
ncbi:MAG TPA: BTAD domain-containing putative transcriptional regulator, partial [Ktedonobacteraceae bacterium]|nr:BTAD domain-containing putative transcriptional regulator [Ktedonobacteraceae bacterium]